MLHAKILSSSSATQTEHARRAFGRYYTPLEVAEQLVGRVLDARDELASEANQIACVDPFCGDGRLIERLMETACARGIRPNSWVVTLWDLDELALATAERNVRGAASRLGLDVVVHASATDALMQAANQAGRFDLVVTNPPWEALKPDRRETMHMSSEQRQSYLDALKDYDLALAQVLPLSQPTRKFSGWGTNLSRCGLELALRLCRPGTGVCGIVLPASVLADQATSDLRRALFTDSHVRHVCHFPAEAKMFAGVDQPFITVVTSADGGTVNTTVERRGRDGQVCETNDFVIDESEMGAFGFRLPCEIPSDLVHALFRLTRFPVVGSLEGKNGASLWMGRELDETGYLEHTSATGEVPFVKGRMIGRYRAPRGYDLFWADDRRQPPASAQHVRLAWRDVSRRSQHRRVQATLLPGGVVTGNSLHVAYFRDDDENRLLTLLAILNSLVVELQVRSSLGTGHVSIGAIRNVRIPDVMNSKTGDELAALATLALSGDQEADSRIESIVARLYGLDDATVSRIGLYCRDPYFDCDM